MTSASQARADNVSSGRRRVWYVVGGMVLVVLAALFMWPRGEESPNRSADMPWNVLLITFDTTRADRLASYGYAVGNAPVLDQLAHDSLRYARCYAPAPATLPSHTSLLTGLYPFRHGLHDNGAGCLDDAAVTLAEVLRDHGYQTGAVMGAYVLHARFGLSQGFDFYEDDIGGAETQSAFFFAERPANAVTDAALDWTDTLDSSRPFFLWVHYFDPHMPYAPPGMTESADEGRRYDGEITFAAQQLERLMRELERLREDTGRETLIVFAADHGESLWEHGEPTHGMLVYNSTLHVPLIVHVPSIGANDLVIEHPVSLVDVFPSVLNWLGLPLPYDVDGRVLPTTAQQTADAAEEPTAPLYFETYLPLTNYGWSPLKGVLLDQKKLIIGPQPELYDLAADPRESQNVYAERPDEVAVLRDALDELSFPLGNAPELDSAMGPLDDNTIMRLQSLGYVGASPTVTDAEPTDKLPDPKTLIGIHRDVVAAQSALEKGDAQRAMQLLRGALAVDPDNRRALFLLRDLVSAPGVGSEVVALLKARMETPLPEPLDVFIPWAVARVTQDPQLMQATRALLEQRVKASPDDPSLAYHLSSLLMEMGEPREVVRPLLEGAVRAAPENSDYAFALALSHELAGEWAEALEQYERILAREPHNFAALNNSAWALYELKRDPETALERSRRAVAQRPDDAPLLHTLGTILVWQNQAAEALERLKRAAQIDPHNAGVQYMLGRALQMVGDTSAAAAAYERAIGLGQSAFDNWLPDARERLATLRR